MSLPRARVTHHSLNRLRIRLPSQKGKHAYFETLQKTLSDYEGADAIEVNGMTGSLLFVGERIDLNSVGEFGEAKGLFTIEASVEKQKDGPKHLPGRIARPLQTVHNAMDELSGGNLDLSGLVFLLLLGTGVYQIARGNFGAPPWYTAFWYAFGVFTKQLMEEAGADETPDE